jgi:sugar phosphate isomerase/epimerase
MKTPPNEISRRNFLALSTAASAAVIANSFKTTAFAADTVTETPPLPKKKYPIGLELYSVRDELARDLPNTLRTVAKMGYEVVEFYAPYFDWKIPYAKEVRTLMDDIGLRCYSTHNHLDSFTPGDTMAKAIELNQILGSRYLIMASEPSGTDGLAGWTKLCDQLTTAAEQFRPHGLAAGFHNHQVEWAMFDSSMRFMDFIAANTPKDFVLQLDVGTCVEAGADPVAWINANPGRIKIVHLKDWAPGSKTDEKSYRVLFGEGVSPWKEIVAALESVGGVEFYLMEQEGSRYSEFETARRCLETWKTFKAKV